MYDHFDICIELFSRLPGKPITASERRYSVLQMSILLNTLMKMDSVWLMRNPKAPSIYAPGICVYDRQQESNRLFTLPVILKEGYGNCHDFGPARAAELNVRGDAKSEPWVDWKRIGEKWAYHVLNWRDSIKRNLPPGRRPGKGDRKLTDRKLKVILCNDRGPVLWEAPRGGFIEDPSRVLGM